MKKTSLFIGLCLCVLACHASAAKTTVVRSIAELQAAIGNALPGDIILLQKGVYTTTDDILVNKAGTAEKPITIGAQSPGGVEITGAGGFRIVSPASHITITGFTFTHASDKAKMEPGTTFCRWTRNVFQTTGEGNYLTIMGSDHQVDYNTFQHKRSLGKFIGVRGTGKQIAERLWIHHNYFVDFTKQSGNGAEAFQFGLSGYSLSSSNSIVEYNLFEQCEGENELISVKASAVTLRYNTIRDCKAQFTLRHGNFCKVYGNYFTLTPGLRIFGDDHIIFSNYFEKCKPAINIGNGGAEVADGAPLTSHDRPDRVLIAFNTLVDNEENITRTIRPNGIGSTFITLAYNIIQGGGEAVSIQGPLYLEPSFKGNIIFQTKGPGQLPDSGFVQADPKLARDKAGIYHLQKGSPAIGAARENFPAVIADLDGQPRISPLDAGADQVSAKPVTVKMLKPGDVGPLADGAIFKKRAR
ncbi:polysaccharide lyase 6 family protein [Chitinophaga sp. 22620]|uniref:polysaccharide lyase 6 family protein n=1 Tax=Chitinophaga sp. 22620 TaxID=3453952 RepID=UPI003F87C90A